MSKRDLLKNPVLQNKLDAEVSSPSGNVMEEIIDQDASGGREAASDFDLSSYLGNKGAYCTLTVECMPSCN